VLAAAVSFADGAIADEENELINYIADELGITDDRASALLDEVEADLRDR
jgi:tellurite resistance protein